MSNLTYDDYKQRINIQSLLTDAGYVRNRKDGLRYPSFVRLDSDGRRIRGDKFIVTQGGQCCFQPPEQKSYNIISFIKEHPDLFKEYHAGMNLDLLVNKVCCRLLNTTYEEKDVNIAYAAQPAEPFRMKDYDIQPYKAFDKETQRHFYPFFKHRGINLMTQNAFAESFVLASKEGKGREYKNLCFPLRIPGKGEDVVGFEQRGRMRRDGEPSFKGKAAGSNASEGLWMASPDNTSLSDAKRVLVFESAYDAMAYYQLKNRDDKELRKAVFVSTGGTPTVNQMKGLILNAPSAEFHLCFDNDMAGKQFVANFQAVLEQVRKNLPKVSEEMKPYMDSLANPKDIFSGEETLLPDDLYEAYDRMFDAQAEALSMKNGGVSSPEDIQEQVNLANEYSQAFRQMMRDRLCIGSEQGRLKEIGTYDIPEWALCAIENGDHEGLSEEEEKVLSEFMDKHFPEGFVSNIRWDDTNELNFSPAFGTRNEHALTSRGESPYQGVKTIKVEFYHPSERDGVALPDIKVEREIPAEGYKDWNDQLLGEQEEQENRKAVGTDIDSDGMVETDECNEQKHRFRR